MIMADYRFLTTWCVDAPIERVWDAMHDLERWPSWWKGVESVVKLDRGDEDGLGSRWRQVWRSRLAYTLAFELRVTRVERPFLLEAVADGQLTGNGRWRLFEGQGTALLYEWKVETTGRGMNLLAPLARPVFVWNHNAIMQEGGRGLARLLDAPLLAQS